MNEVFGTFILTQESNEFTGEFFNNHVNEFVTESVTPNEIDGAFAGTYTTQWSENGRICTSALIINANPNNVFDLRWTNVTVDGEPSKVEFVGRGVLRGNILSSVYSEVKA